MLRLYHVWLVPAAFTLLGFGPGAAKAIAQTTYPFEATYNAEITTRAIAPNISKTSETGESADAPYGLTNLTIVNYAELDPDTSVFTFGPDPATFGLEDLPFGTFTLSGNGSDKLFGTISGSVSVDFENLVGTGSSTITITGGEGRFSGATGTLGFLENDTFSPDPTAPIQAQFSINGSFEAVPEPIPNTTVIGISAIGVGFLLHSRRNSRKRAV
jgi:hypothetical protein